MNNSIQSLKDMEKLLKEKILDQSENIVINLIGIPKISRSNDIIGNCLQEWLPEWFKDNGLDLKANKDTQSFPDFVAHFNDHSEMVDIKCWNYNRRPAFDIANFDSFYKTLYNNPAKLFAKYLTIGYTPQKHGFTIDYVELKKLWEITGKSTKYPLSVQVKQKRPYAIRPVNFSKNPEDSFNTPQELLEAVAETRKLFPNNTIPYTEKDWYARVTQSLSNL